MEYFHYYQNIAHKFNEIRPDVLESYTEKISLLFSENNISTSSKVLEIGSGTGKYISRLCHETGCLGIGIEISRDMILNSTKKKSTYYINADAQYIPLKSNLFDLVYAVNSIHQIVEIDRLFSEIHRVLKPEGKLIILTPDLKKLRKFPLYAACPSLYSFESRRLPSEDFIKLLGEKHRFRFLKSAYSTSNKQSFSVNNLLHLIQNRFLSCLSHMNDAQLAQISKQVEIYIKGTQKENIKPYHYLSIILIKGGQNGILNELGYRITKTIIPRRRGKADN